MCVLSSSSSPSGFVSIHLIVLPALFTSIKSVKYFSTCSPRHALTKHKSAREQVPTLYFLLHSLSYDTISPCVCCVVGCMESPRALLICPLAALLSNRNSLSRQHRSAPSLLLLLPSRCRIPSLCVITASHAIWEG